MNRTLYFLTMLISSVMINSLEHSMAINNVAIVVAFILIFGQLAAGMFRWQNMGYNKWWGLLTILPVVPLYGMIMPPNAKTTGIDTAGKVWLAVLLAIIVLMVVALLSSGV